MYWKDSLEIGILRLVLEKAFKLALLGTKVNVKRLPLIALKSSKIPYE